MSNNLDLEDDFDDSYGRGSKEPHRGVLILVLGILSLMICGIIGIFAWLMGKRDLELMKSGRMDKEGEALTKVGYILGIVGTILFLIGMVLATLYIVAIIFFVAAKP